MKIIHGILATVGALVLMLFAVANPAAFVTLMVFALLLGLFIALVVAVTRISRRSPS